MKCHFYMNLLDGASRRLGPYDIGDEAQARRMAEAELQLNPDVQAVDIWWDNGELYRIERPAAVRQYLRPSVERPRQAGSRARILLRRDHLAVEFAGAAVDDEGPGHAESFEGRARRPMRGRSGAMLRPIQ